MAQVLSKQVTGFIALSWYKRTTDSYVVSNMASNQQTTLSRLQHFFYALRSGIFYLFWVFITFVWFIPSLFVAFFLPLKARHFVIGALYSRIVIWSARLICGIKWHVVGQENLPTNQQGYVVLSKHQSTWETFFLVTLLYPQVPVVKAELAYLPVFGWILKLVQPIWINRNKKTNALKQVVEQGKERLKRGISIMIFPEGTRVEPGKRKVFSKGGALLATSAKAPVIAVAHNSGEFWSNRQWVKKPGTVKVVISPVINTEDITTKQLNSQVESWINEQVDRISIVPFNGEYSMAQSSGKRF